MEGMMLFLIASGLTLIFGVSRIINFAHGSLYMLGAFLTYQFTPYLFDGSLFGIQSHSLESLPLWMRDTALLPRDICQHAAASK